MLCTFEYGRGGEGRSEQIGKSLILCSNCWFGLINFSSPPWGLRRKKGFGRRRRRRRRVFELSFLQGRWGRRPDYNKWSFLSRYFLKYWKATHCVCVCVCVCTALRLIYRIEGREGRDISNLSLNINCFLAQHGFQKCRMIISMTGSKVLCSCKKKSIAGTKPLSVSCYSQIREAGNHPHIKI